MYIVQFVHTWYSTYIYSTHTLNKYHVFVQRTVQSCTGSSAQSKKVSSIMYWECCQSKVSSIMYWEFRPIKSQFNHVLGVPPNQKSDQSCTGSAARSKVSSIMYWESRPIRSQASHVLGVPPNQKSVQSRTGSAAQTPYRNQKSVQPCRYCILGLHIIQYMYVLYQVCTNCTMYIPT